MPTSNKEPSSWDIVVLGGVNTDYLIRGQQLPKPGQTMEGDTFQTAPGGKGANQAVAAARLGARVTIVGRVGGGSRGNAMIDALGREGVHTQYLMPDEHSETGAAVIMVSHSGEKQILTAPGANLKVTMDDLLRAEPAIRAARVLLAQLEVPVAVVAEALRLARSLGLRTVVDPAPPHPLDSTILKSVEVIKPNESEAEALTGIRVTNRDSARSAAQSLLRQGVQAVAISAGPDGNLLVWQTGEHWLPRIRVESIDATGAGDAFAATLAFGLASNKTLIEAGREANAAAAFATTKLGAQASLPHPQDIEATLARAA